MSEVTITVRTADQTRKAEVTVDRENKGSDIIQNAVENWELPTDTEYQLTNVTQQKTIMPDENLSEKVVNDDDTLEVQPVLVAGSNESYFRSNFTRYK